MSQGNKSDRGRRIMEVSGPTGTEQRPPRSIFARMTDTIPAYVLEVAIRRAEEGPVPYVFREDVKMMLGRSQATAFVDLTDLEKQTLLSELEMHGAKVLRAGMRHMRSEDPRVLLGGAVKFVLKLVDERLYEDVKNQAVLCSLLLQEEIDRDGDMEWGSDYVRSSIGGMMLDEARRLGMYSRVLLLQ